MHDDVDIYLLHQMLDSLYAIVNASAAYNRVKSW